MNNFNDFAIDHKMINTSGSINHIQSNVHINYVQICYDQIRKRNLSVIYNIPPELKLQLYTTNGSTPSIVDRTAPILSRELPGISRVPKRVHPPDASRGPRRKKSPIRNGFNRPI